MNNEPDPRRATSTDRAPIFTIGHGSRSFEQFLEVLTGAEVELLIDVRRFPGSKRHPQFGRDALESRLGDEGIGYQWWGESMGGRRAEAESSQTRHGSWRNAAFRAYAGHMDTSEFRKALNRLVVTSKDRSVAIMCAETLWWKCHRRLIADALLTQGLQVVHLGIEPPASHSLSSFARVDENGLLAYDGSETPLF